MKSDEKTAQILAALQALQPALNEEDAAKLTNSIMAGIANKKQVGKTRGKLLSMAKTISVAAAILLLVFLLYQQVAESDEHQSGVIYNPYYKKIARNQGSLPPTKSMSELLDHYWQLQKDKSTIAGFREQYHQMSGKK